MREAEFMKAILEAPEDDAPRLIFADWLDEHGQPERAEFIRAQCAIAAPWSEDSGECWQCNCGRRGTQHTNGKCRCSLEWKALRRRERGLLLTHGCKWLAPPMRQDGNTWEVITSPRWQPGDLPGVEYRHGFVEALALSAEAWLQHADALVKVAPIREVTLTTWPMREPCAIGEGYARLVSRLFAAECPGIKFTLPNQLERFAATQTSWDGTTADELEFLKVVREQINRDFGIPQT